MEEVGADDSAWMEGDGGQTTTVILEVRSKGDSKECPFSYLKCIGSSLVLEHPFSL
jgi:hypothetical protein